MKLLDIYSMMERNEITEEEAAQSLGMPVKVLRFRVTRLGLKFPLYLAILTRSEKTKSQEVKQQKLCRCRSEVSKLLEKHFVMPWGDLKHLDSQKRMRLVTEIEKAEDLELAKQQALNAIGSGKKTLETEALDRLISRKQRKKQ